MGWRRALVLVAACGGGSSHPDAGSAIDGPRADAVAIDAAANVSNRDRLLATYLAYLKTTTARQSNGLLGSELADVCALWGKLDPSSQATFLTITARLQGSVIASDGSAMLDHVTKLYRAVGGQNATATDPGSCGGGEYNRLIMQMDSKLHDVLAATNADKGMSGGQIQIRDVTAASYWRDSHDLGGPHAPFDLSDETNAGAPRGQVQYFADVTSAAATAPLGRLDLAALVEPLGLEMDEDFDCVHNSNPSCSYTSYGPACALEPNLTGTAIYQMSYGDFQPGYKPSGC